MQLEPHAGRRIAATVAVALAVSSACRRTEPASGNQPLDDGRGWLDSAATPAPTSPALLRAAAANAPNQTAESERLLLDVIRAQPASESARRSHELLSRIYLRSGRYAKLIANLDAWARDFPNDEDLREEQADIEQFRGLPDQINGARSTATLPHGEGNDFSAPLTINGQPATYLLDTGAWMSVLTEAEAKHIHMGRTAASRTDAENGRDDAAQRASRPSDLSRHRNLNLGLTPLASAEALLSIRRSWVEATARERGWRTEQFPVHYRGPLSESSSTVLGKELPPPCECAT